MTRKPNARSAPGARLQPGRRPTGDAGASSLGPLPLVPESLGYALDAAASALTAVRGGAALPGALNAVFATLPAAASRGAVQDIAYRTMRRLGCVDALLALMLKSPPAAHVRSVLACALALLVEPPGTAAYTPFTLVNQAVRAIAARKQFHFARGMVNAVLRRFLREREALLAAVANDPVAQWNYPAWWIDAVRNAWPAQWQGILEAGNARAPLTLRVNRRRTTVPAYLDRLEKAGLAAVRNGEAGVTLAQALPVDQLPGFADGLVSVQDAGAQQAAALLDVRDGMRVLDACAAPGGKTGHLLELADIDLLALESDASRAARIRENLTRLGLDAEVRTGDAGEPQAWWDGRPFERILADVPCSASGIVRRHPDIRWLRRASDLPALIAAQRRIVEALWPLLAPGGELLYVTCSVFPEEGQAQAEEFECRLADAVRLDAPGQMLPDAGRDAASDHDGFFYARFRKQ
jgi:16S rRNA (cytosine967-C5)-methyltransferase